jgi:menaquinone-dependent protoporphyrinogen oxidase
MVIRSIRADVVLKGEPLREVVAVALRERGLKVDIRPMRETRILEGCGAVVLGAPLCMGRWHKDARRFLLEHREPLTQRSAAVFALGPLSTGGQGMLGSRNQLGEELEKCPWLTPVAVKMFGGKYNPSKLDFFHRLLTALPANPIHGLPVNDVRDWTAIRAWASDLTQKLRPASLQ